jgi:predicted nicotinamide N-methyase
MKGDSRHELEAEETQKPSERHSASDMLNEVYYTLARKVNSDEPEHLFRMRVQQSTKILELSLEHCIVDLWGQWQLSLRLKFQPDDIQPLFSGGTWAGSVVWPASLMLCDYMREYEEKVLGSKCCKVIELGAGLGVPSQAASLLGASLVYATEQDPLPSLIQHNIDYTFEEQYGSDRLGSRKKPMVAGLDWKKPGDQFANVRFDLILISDCVYEGLYGESWRDLADVIKTLSTPGITRTLNALERRKHDGVDRFLRYCEKIGVGHKLLKQETGPENECLELYELRLLKKEVTEHISESLAEAQRETRFDT